MKGSSDIYAVLGASAPQLRNIGTFNPAKLDPVWKDWLMRAERVFIDTFGGDFQAFFGAVATVYQNAKDDELDPSNEIKEWLMAEIRELKKKEKKH